MFSGLYIFKTLLLYRYWPIDRNTESKVAYNHCRLTRPTLVDAFRSINPKFIYQSISNPVPMISCRNAIVFWATGLIHRPHLHTLSVEICIFIKHMRFCPLHQTQCLLYQTLQIVCGAILPRINSAPVLCHLSICLPWDRSHSPVDSPALSRVCIFPTSPTGATNKRLFWNKILFYPHKPMFCILSQCWLLMFTYPELQVHNLLKLVLRVARLIPVVHHLSFAHMNASSGHLLAAIDTTGSLF